MTDTATNLNLVDNLMNYLNNQDIKLKNLRETLNRDLEIFSLSLGEQGRKLNSLEKRLTSTEAQIRKLFALSESNGKDKEVINESTKTDTWKDLIFDKKTLPISVRSGIQSMVIECGKCGNMQPMATWKRSIRLTSDGNIASIYFSKVCKLCNNIMEVEV